VIAIAKKASEKSLVFRNIDDRIGSDRDDGMDSDANAVVVSCTVGREFQPVSGRSECSQATR
jgi:hypothetical protein